MQYKRILMSCLIVILILCTSVLSIGATSEATPFEQAVGVISPTAVSNEPFVVQAGDTFEVSVSIENNPGFSGFQFILEYDSTAVTFKEMVLGEMLPAETSAYEWYSFTDDVENKITFIAYLNGGVSVVENGTVVKFKFEVNSGYHGTTSVDFTKNIWMYDYAGIDCNVKSNGAVIAVHNYADAPVITDPTCTEDGYITYTCSDPDCTDKTLVLPGEPMTGHDMAEATCTEPATCKNGCGYTEGTELGHDMAEATCTEPATCKRGCGHTEGTALGHDMAEATCTEPATCKRGCGHTEGEALGHDMAEATCTEPATCKRGCGHTEGEALGHDMAEATCTEPATCKRGCGHTEGTALGHDWAEATCTTPKTCKREGCGVTEGELAPHTFGEWTTVKAPTCTEKGSKERVCTATGCTAKETDEISADGHNYSTEWTIDKEATCTEAGSKSHHCLNCDDKTDVTPIDPKTHTYGDWTTVTAPTCTEKGSEKQTCVACGNVETRDIDATGHKPVACDEVEATKEKEGSTGGTKCSVCGTILTEPTVVPMLKDYTWIYILVAVVVVVAIGGGVCAYFFVIKKKGTPTAVAAEEEVSVEQAFAEETKTEDNQAEEKAEE